MYHPRGGGYAAALYLACWVLRCGGIADWGASHSISENKPPKSRPPKPPSLREVARRSRDGGSFPRVVLRGELPQRLGGTGRRGWRPLRGNSLRGTPSVTAYGGDSSLREGALGFCLAASPARVAPAKRGAGRFVNGQTPLNLKSRGKSFRLRRSFRRALVGTNCTT